MHARNLLVRFVLALLIWFDISSVFAAPPTPPSGFLAGGQFAQYFKNIVEGGLGVGTCPAGQGVVGFNTGASSLYGLPICQAIASSQWTTTGSNIYYSAGNVGIGTNNPGSPLHIMSNSDSPLVLQTSDNTWLYTQWLESNGTRRAWVGLSNNLSTFNIALENATNALIIPTGNVGIGTTSPASKLDVNGAIKALGSSIFAQSNNSDTAYWAAPIQIREAMYGGSSGYIPPRISLHWGGVVASQIGIESSGRIKIMNNPGTGYENFVANDITAANYYYNSDKNLKKDIILLTGSLDNVRKLKGYSFTWKKDNTPAIGVIAQEVEKIFPEIVSTDNETGLKSVQYGNLVAPLIESTKELADKSDAQDKEIQELKRQVAELREIVSHK